MLGIGRTEAEVKRKISFRGYLSPEIIDNVGNGFDTGIYVSIIVNIYNAKFERGERGSRDTNIRHRKWDR